VLKQGLRFWPQQGVDVKALFHKGIELRRPFLGVFEALNGLVFELPHRNQWLQVRVWDDTFS